jgi:hypothetical protein
MSASGLAPARAMQTLPRSKCAVHHAVERCRTLCGHLAMREVLLGALKKSSFSSDCIQAIVFPIVLVFKSLKTAKLIMVMCFRADSIQPPFLVLSLTSSNKPIAEWPNNQGVRRPSMYP